jgi:hypothetical protein
MNKIGLVVTINKFKHYWETSQTTWSCDTIDEANEKLINHLAKELGNLNIDYPLDLADFEHQWFNQQYANSNAFYYGIFMEGVWHQPWEHQDIYSDVLNKMEQNEQVEPPNFEEIYGEPDPDEDKIDNFSMENNEQIHEFEKKLTQIITDAKSVSFKEDQVKECKCEKCKQSYDECNQKPVENNIDV